MASTFPVGAVFAAPVPDAERVLAVSLFGRVHAIEPERSEVLWSVEVGAPVDGHPALAPDRTLVVPCRDGSLVALDPDGTQRWRYQGRRAGVVSPTGRHAFRGGVFVSRSGVVIAGSDDGHVHGVALDGQPRFATPTGFWVRGTPAAGLGGSVLVAGLDLKLMALDPETGDIRWRRGLGNLPSGLCAGPDGTVLATTLGGAVVAFDGVTGDERWRRELGSPIATAAAPLFDGAVVGTLDGRLVTLGPTGQVRRETWLGAPVRAGLVVGTDGCVYVAAGASVHAFGPDTQPRWRWDPGVGQLQGRIALGAPGVVVAGRNGVAVAALDDPDLLRGGLDPGPEGGRLDPVSDRVLPGDIVSLRVVFRDVAPEPAVLEGPLRTASDLAHTAVRTAEGQHVHLVPAEVVAGDHRVRVEAGFRAGGERRALQAEVPFSVQPVVGALAERLRLTGLHVLDPAVVEAFDPAGAASLTLDVVRVEAGVAWGILNTRRPRRIAFSVHDEPGTLVLEAAPSRFELGGLPLSGEVLRLVVHADGSGSLLARAAPGAAPWPSLRLLQQAMDHPRAALERSGKPILAARDLFRGVAGLFEGRPTREQLTDLGRFAPRALGLARLLDPAVWGPWGLLDAERRFLCVGRFGHAELAPSPHRLRVREVRADAARRKVTARLEGEGAPGPLGVLLVDTEAGTPVALDYTGRTRAAGEEVQLEIPLATNLSRPVDALVLAGLEVLWRGALTG